MKRSQDKRKVKLFYLDEQLYWRQYTQATLTLSSGQSQKSSLLFTISEPIAEEKIQILPLPQIYSQTDKTITIQMNMITVIEKLDDLLIAFKIQQWNRTLSLSFRDEQYSQIILEQLQLQINSSTKFLCQNEQLLDYFLKEMQKNISFVDWIFTNESNLQSFITFIKETEFTQDKQHKLFKIVKQVFFKTNKKIFETIIKDEYFKYILQALSYNYEFGDRRIDYVEQFKKINKFQNILQVQDQYILSHYQDIMKLRFLLDYPTSMFIQIYTQAIIHEIIRQKTFDIMKNLLNNHSFYTNFKELSLKNPVFYIELFSELWEMFKSVLQDNQTKQVKQKFYQNFLQQNLLSITFSSIYQISHELSKENKIENRLYQKFVESINPFLSYKWQDSQKIIIQLFQKSKINIGDILLSILGHADYNTKSIILVFIKNLLQITQNRRSIKQSFYGYVFNQIIRKLPSFFEKISQLEILVDFYMKIYKIDPQRARSCIIQSKLIHKIHDKHHNKYILLIILKLIRSFLQNINEQIFIYLDNNKFFYFLRNKYHQTKKYSPRGVIYSMFLGLMKDTKYSQNKAGIKYVYNILFPNDK